jgi:hypothetical protein
MLLSVGSKVTISNVFFSGNKLCIFAKISSDG